MDKRLWLFPWKFNNKIRLVFLMSCFCLFTQANQSQVVNTETKKEISNDNKNKPNAKLNRGRGLDMLSEIKDLIKKAYYDPKFHGINLDERFNSAAERIKKLETNSQIFRVIAQVLAEFNDSHTRFIPPSRKNTFEYGFSMQMIGNNCFVVDVKKESDAENKGLKSGDVILTIGSYIPTKENFWKIEYLIYSLDPQESLNLVTKSFDGKEHEIHVKSKIKTPEEVKKEIAKRKNEKKEKPYKCQEINSELIACKLYTFSVEKGTIDKMMKEVGEHRKLILDLRGNGGGYVSTEIYLTSYFFNHDVKIGDEITRKKTIERIAKSRREKVFNGELIVLIDSDSASASEVFARVIQIEKRGKIVGDVSAGAVMTSQIHYLTIGHNTMTLGVFVACALNLTVGDLIMSDGNRLEDIGVIPDFPVGPTSYALAQKTDPVLSFAVSKLGGELTPEKAGTFYFMRQKPEGIEDDVENDSDDK